MVVDDAVVIEAFADVGSKRAEFRVFCEPEPKRRVFAPSEFAELIGLEQDAVKIFVASSIASIASGMLISSVSPMNAKVMW